MEPETTIGETVLIGHTKTDASTFTESKDICEKITNG